MQVPVYLTTLANLEQNEYFFGPQGFRTVTNAEDLEHAQVSYSYDENGTDLTGTNEGDWQKSWVVIAVDLEMGDPYFIDTRQDNLPVYTAVPYDGPWLPELVATSLEGFLSSLVELTRGRQQRAPQFVPDDSSITDEETLEQLAEKLTKLSGDDQFWQTFFVNYVDWLEDDDEF
ncbi:MAG: hypothetical protein HRT38_16105 [Alteromonadaceae bacterium]|nr:hypothetical protein [Alteromonadaceae bacterium]